MVKLILFLSMTVLLLGGVSGEDQVPPDADKPHDKTTTTTEIPTTSTTTTPTKPTTTTTTPTPPTTSTTTPTTPTTTTPAPEPTTTAKPIPPPKPYPGNEGKWTWEDDKNVTCMMLKGALQLDLVYDQQGKNATASIDVPRTANVSGNCSPSNVNTQKLTLLWSSKDENITNSVTFVFEKNDTNATKGSVTDNGITSGKYALENVTIVLYRDPAIFVNETGKTHKTIEVSITNKAAFQTPLSHSYSCLTQEMLKSSDGNSTLKLSDIHFEAFRTTPAGHREFSASVECPSDDASDVVPIVVGAVLAGLIVVVLAAYLVGRRRSRSRGYQSV